MRSMMVSYLVVHQHKITHGMRDEGDHDLPLVGIVDVFERDVFLVFE